MGDMKKYTSVIRYGKRGTENVLSVGDEISITEKLDGSNASFCYDENKESLVSCFSRNQELDAGNTLRGFYGYVMESVSPRATLLNKAYVYFGEYLVSHTVVYKEEAYKKFYLFSIWDREKCEYLSDEIVKNEAERLGLQIVPYLYEGEFISYDHLLSFVGKSDISLEQDKGEGIVVKNVNYFDHNKKQVFVKLVRPEFAECMGQKPNKNPKEIDGRILALREVITDARIEKIFHKGIDEGHYVDSVTIKDMGTILKYIGKSVYEDILKEEPDSIIDIEESVINKSIGKYAPIKVRELLTKRQGGNV